MVTTACRLTKKLPKVWIGLNLTFSKRGKIVHMSRVIHFVQNKIR